MNSMNPTSVATLPRMRALGDDFKHRDRVASKLDDGFRHRDVVKAQTSASGSVRVSQSYETDGNGNRKWRVFLDNTEEHLFDTFEEAMASVSGRTAVIG